ncbi:MAG: hypothetical protein M1438_16300 [Deltaproteobacteria bacterium]|nr:hypothetical protein [Deltaproteobacteria bacterium]
MASDWHIAAFPLILPWRDDFWTLPLYFPDLKVGVTPGWPSQLRYQGLPLPPEARIQPQELKHLNPGDLRQWWAFQEYREAQAESDDLLGDLRRYGQAPRPSPDSSPQLWSLAWQLEKLQADQETQLVLVDRGEDWLKDILTPEPWEDRPSYSREAGALEMVDPDLARLRYALWRRVMAPQLQDPWAPFLLGRTARSLFLALKGWPESPGPQSVKFSLPGMHTAEEWRTVCPNGKAPPWQAQAVELLGALLEEASDLETLETAAGELGEFITGEVLGNWPFPVIGKFDLEVWVADAEGQAPVFCWSGAGSGNLPE